MYGKLGGLKKMKIYILGFMGCGKSTVGKRLAAYCGCSFVDTDELFSQRHNCSVKDYFDLYAEEKFRQEERKILHTTQLMENTVIAVGGGTPCFYDNMDWMLSHGLCVYLEMPPKALFNRLKNSKSERPVLQTGNLYENIQILISQREPYYQKANIAVSGLDVDILTLNELICQYVNEKKLPKNHE